MQKPRQGAVRATNRRVSECCCSSRKDWVVTRPFTLGHMCVSPIFQPFSTDLPKCGSWGSVFWAIWCSRLSFHQDHPRGPGFWDVPCILGVATVETFPGIKIMNRNKVRVLSGQGCWFYGGCDWGFCFLLGKAKLRAPRWDVWEFPVTEFPFRWTFGWSWKDVFLTHPVPWKVMESVICSLKKFVPSLISF